MDPHQSSLNKYDRNAFGFINSLLQVCLCQHSPLEFMKPTSWSLIDELRSIEKPEKVFAHKIPTYKYTHPSKSTQSYIHITYAYAPPITNNLI